MNRILLCSFAILAVYCGLAQSACSSVCPSGWTDIGQYCVRISEPTDSYTNAQTACAAIGGSILSYNSIVNAGETQNLYNFIYQSGITQDYSYFWVNGELFLYDASDNSQTLFLTVDGPIACNAPQFYQCHNNGNDTNLFFYVAPNNVYGLVNSPDNTYVDPALCVMPVQPQPCPVGWVYLDGPYCVMIAAPTNSYVEAQTECANVGGSLLSVLSLGPEIVALVFYVQSIITSSSDRYFWIQGQLANYDANDSDKTYFQTVDGILTCPNIQCNNVANATNLFLDFIQYNPGLAIPLPLLVVNSPDNTYTDPVLCQMDANVVGKRR